MICEDCNKVVAHDTGHGEDLIIMDKCTRIRRTLGSVHCDCCSSASSASDSSFRDSGPHCTRGRSCSSSRFYSIALLVVVIFSATCVPPVLSEEPSSSLLPNTVVSESEVSKTVEPTNNPTKVFVRRRIFRKIVKDQPAATNSSSSSIEESPDQPTVPPPPSTKRPRTLYSLVKRLDSNEPQPRSGTVTGSTLKSSMSTSVSLSSKQKFNFASLKTRLGLAVTDVTTTMIPPTTTTPIHTTEKTQNDSLVMIPLPPNQRKPYTPVIMQVTKSTTSKPSTMQTYKLNKMFVPIGIYGKVLENSTSSSEQSTPNTEIRHKGTDSGENSSERKHKGIADTVDITYNKPDPGRYSLTTEKPDIGLISITTEANELFGGSNILNGLRRGDSYSSYYGGYNNNNGGYNNNNNGGGRRNKPYSGQQVSSSEGMTLMTPPKLGTSEDSPSTLADSLSSYSSYASYSNKNSNSNKFTPSSMLDSITDSMSKIPSLVPSLFHKGLTSLTSLTSSLKENPFVDENFNDNKPKKQPPKPLVSGSYSPPHIPASVPGGYINGLGGGGGGKSGQDQVHAGSEIAGGSGSAVPDMSEYETLEYFRKRPYLLAQLQKQRQQQQQGSWRRSKQSHQQFRLSKGFKPATAPDLLAREYYKSTSTTTQMTPDPTPPVSRRGSKHMMRGSWLMRNSNEYVAKKNENLVRMWRNMLDSFTNDDDDDEDEEDVGKGARHRETPSKSKMASRISKIQSKKSPVLSSYWSNIKSKYSKSQINEAKERILTLLNSGYGDDALLQEPTLDEDDEELLQHVPDYEDHHDTTSHMPPPPPPPVVHRTKTLTLTKGLSGAAAGAFKDLVKFFKLGVSVGAGQAREPVNYEQVVDLQEEEEQNWKPVRRPLISFSAGISLKNPSSSSPPIPKGPKHHLHLHHIHPTVEVEEEAHYPPQPLPHYTSSVVTAYSKPSLNTYIDELASSSHPHEPVKTLSYASYNSNPEEEEEHDELITGSPSPVAQALDYDEDPSAYESNTQSYLAEAPLRYTSPSSSSGSRYYDYSTLKSAKGQGGSWSPVTAAAAAPSPSSDYELVPSSVYLNGQNDPRDIAAVVKPAGISDAAVRSVLPQGLRNLRILDYPNEYASLNSISQALGGGGGAAASGNNGFKAAMKKLRQNYMAKESLYLPQESQQQQLYSTGGLEEIEAPSILSSGTATRLSGLGLSGLSSLTGAGSGTTTRLSGLGLSGLSSLASSSGGLVHQPSTSVPTYSSNPYLSHLALQPYYSPLQQQSSLLVGGNTRESVFATANRINNLSGARGQSIQNAYLQQQQQAVPPQKDALGFTSDYNLPQHLDPDIAAILKSELDKDDIPEDVRQEFLEAKEQEKKKKQQQASRRADDAQQTLIDSLLNTAIEKTRQYNLQLQQQQQTTPPPTTTSQPYIPPTHASPPQQTHHAPPPPPMMMPAQSRSYSYHRHNMPPPPPPPMPQSPPVVTTRFFAPIPITPTLMTTAMRNPRYSSPVPRYVIELAKKLQNDRNVQGIVRVSAKRGRGLPPIEYLYPVKG